MIDVTQSVEDRLATIEQALEALEVQPRDRHYVRRALELLTTTEVRARIRLAMEAAEQVSQISTADVQVIHEEISGKVLAPPFAMLGRAVRPGEMIPVSRSEVRTVTSLRATTRPPRHW